MSSYITNTKPSFFQVFLSKLGIIELPIKVNCWYCNQNSFLLPGSKNTPRHWYCHLCENVNSRDDKGDVIDPSPLETNTERASVPFVIRSPSIVKKNSENTICEQCQDNLNLIQSILQDYIPDESDPSYKFKCDNVDQYTAELHQRYPLCNDCRAKLNRLSEEQKENLRKVKVSTLLKDSLKTKVAVRPKKNKFYFKGVLWGLVHAVTLLYVLYAILYPSTLEYQPQLLLNDCFEYLHNFDLHKTILNSKEFTNDFFISIYQEIRDPDTGFRGWAGNNRALLATVANILSYSAITWHPIQLNSFFQPNETLNWNLYKSMQHVLFFMRFAFIFLTSFNSSIHNFTIYTMLLLVIYYIVLFVTFNIVSVKTAYSGLQKVGRSFASYTEFEETSNMNDSSNFEDNMSIVSETTSFINHSQDPLDNIVSGVDRIRFYEEVTDDMKINVLGTSRVYEYYNNSIIQIVFSKLVTVSSREQPLVSGILDQMKAKATVATLSKYDKGVVSNTFIIYRDALTDQKIYGRLSSSNNALKRHFKDLSVVIHKT